MPKVGMEPIRRAETINAALDCFCDYGMDKTTLDMVAERAGFSKGVVSYYFKSKRQLTLECMKAFLKSYKMKINSVIREDMAPIQMLKSVIEVSLPPVNEVSEDKINVSELNGVEKIRLPQEKIAKLFTLFVSKAAIDDELKNIMREVYAGDIEGISILTRYAKKTYQTEKVDDIESAYTLLALIYGLSFFRVTEFMPPGEKDNQEVAIHFINHLFGLNS